MPDEQKPSKREQMKRAVAGKKRAGKPVQPMAKYASPTPDPECPRTPCLGCGLPCRMYNTGDWVCGNRRCDRFGDTSVAPVEKVAAAATPKKENRSKPRARYVKDHPRSANAREERMKTRGRLPDRTTATATYLTGRWYGNITVWDSKCSAVRSFLHEAEGLFRLMEELDVMFWEWYAQRATDAEKARLVFAPLLPESAPEPYPVGPGSTAVASP